MEGIQRAMDKFSTAMVQETASVMLLHCSCLSLNPFIEFRIREQLIKF